LLNRIVIAVLVASLLTGMAAAEYSFKSNLTLSMEQKVEGQGYFMSYKYARMPNALGMEGIMNNGVEAKDYLHGSGSISSDFIVSAENSEKEEGEVNDEDMGFDYQEALSCIQMKEDSNMVYSPMSVAIGTGYYAVSPINFNSLIKEKTWLKNRGSGSSMHHEVEYAHGLDKDLELLVKSFISEEDPSISMMNVTEDVTTGRTHIGVLQIDPLLQNEEGTGFSMLGVASPLIEIDEDFVGTFHIEKKLNLTSSVDETEEETDWLPCCSGGFEDLPKKYPSHQGIFDCSCYKVPATAQFPR